MVGTTNTWGLHPSPCVQSLQLFPFPPRMWSKEEIQAAFTRRLPWGESSLWPLSVSCSFFLSPLLHPGFEYYFSSAMMVSEEELSYLQLLEFQMQVAEAQGSTWVHQRLGFLDLRHKAGWGAVWLQHTTGVSLGCGFWLYSGDIQAPNIEFVLPSQLWGSPERRRMVFRNQRASVVIGGEPLVHDMIPSGRVWADIPVTCLRHCLDPWSPPHLTAENFSTNVWNTDDPENEF